MTTEEEDFDEITLEEDMYFSKLADKRLAEAKYWVKHEDFWSTPPAIAMSIATKQSQKPL